MGYNAHFYEKDGTLWFHIDKPSIAGAPAIPLEWDGPATEMQKGYYARQLAQFEESKKAKEEVKEVMFESSSSVLKEIEEVLDKEVA